MNPAADRSLRHWVVVPAAGVGRRLGGSIPKQYLPLNGVPMLQHTLQRLRSVPGLSIAGSEGGIIALAEDDRWWPALDFPDKDWWQTTVGGAERSDSVLAALDALAPCAAEDDWVLVHDVARPCVDAADIARLIAVLKDHPVGGILAVPLADTVKVARPDAKSDPAIETTLDRSRLWAAQTPQMFRFGLLRASLQFAARSRLVVTDEASALEQQGYQPLLVRGRRDNIKVTEPDDLALATAILQLSDTRCEKSS